MTTAATQAKAPPESAALRAEPPSVVRLNRRTLSVLAGVLSAAVLGATLWPLQSVKHERSAGALELHNVDRVSKAENLDRLPADYSKKNVSPKVAPVLGPPLPGDLGRPMLRAEHEANHAGRYDDQANSEQVGRAREADEAAKSPVHFKQGSRASLGSGNPSSLVAGPGLPAPMDRSVAHSVGTDSRTMTSTGAADPVDRKQEFLERSSAPTSQSTNQLQLPISPFLLTAGTVIPAALVTGISSDLPGPIVATVTESVFDTATGRDLLIPQGSRLIGTYDSQVLFGQRRLLMVWTRLILPDASSIVLDRLQGLDAEGRAGLEDRVDWHWGRLLAGAALSTLLGVGAEMAAPQRGGGEGQVIIATRRGLQDAVNDVGQELTKKNLDVRPTITIRPGFQLAIMVNKDIALRPYRPLSFGRGAP